MIIVGIRYIVNDHVIKPILSVLIIFNGIIVYYMFETYVSFNFFFSLKLSVFFQFNFFPF